MPYYEYGRKCLRYVILFVINSAHLEFVETTDINGFQHFNIGGYIKQNLLQSYQETCPIIDWYSCLSISRP